MIFGRLKQFVDARLGGDAWATLLDDAGIGSKIYLASSAYPDAEIAAIVGAASARSGVAAPELLEGFGEFLVPAYLEMYGHLVKPEWGALDLIEHTEETIHKVVRLRSPGAAPPVLQCTRTSVDGLRIEYTSARRLCAVARGILRGVGARYRRSLVISETACMLEGAPSCIIHVHAP